MELIVNLAPFYGHLTGIGRYTLHLLLALRERPEIERISGLTLKGLLPPERLEELLERVDRTAQKRGLLHRLRMVAGHLPYAFSLVQALQGRHLRRAKGGALYWEPSYVLLPYAGPKVVTVHDLSHLRYPECHPPERRRWLSENLPKSLERADQILTISHFTRRELLERFPVSKPISVVPPGVDGSFRPYSEEEARGVLSRYRLGWKGYLLAVATLEPRKNLGRLLEAFSGLPQALRRRFPLVLIGPPGWGERRLSREIARWEARGELRRLGYLPRRDLPYLYAGARLLAYPSLYEGFGMPIVEAMACGTPVLTSNRGALEETSGEAALLVDPERVEAIRDGLLRLLEDRALGERLRREGLARASLFRWERSAERMVQCLLEAGGEG